eukprot:2291761-Pyramimonas_sp.AAC.1
MLTHSPAPSRSMAARRSLPREGTGRDTPPRCEAGSSGSGSIPGRPPWARSTGPKVRFWIAPRSRGRRRARRNQRTTLLHRTA